MEAQLVGEVMLYRDGKILPRAGGWRDQDPRFVEATTFVTEDLRVAQADLVKIGAARNGGQ